MLVRIEAERRHDEMQPQVIVGWHYYVGPPRTRQLLNFDFRGPLIYDDVAVELHTGPKHERSFIFVTEDGERTHYVSLGRIEPGQDADIEVAKVSNYFDVARLRITFRRGKSIWKLAINKSIDKDVEERFTRDLVATGEMDSDAGARRDMGLPVGGVHFAIDAETAARLLAAEDDEDVIAIIEEIEGDPEADVDQCESHKAWDAIHRSITDGLLTHDNGEYPLNATILGGRQLYEGDDYIVSLLAPHQVRDVAESLALVDRDRLLTGYRSIDVDDYGGDIGDQDFEYTWTNFTKVAAFFRRAANAGRHVVFTVDR